MFRLTSIWRSGISIVSHGGRISLPSVSMSDGHHVRPLSRHEGRPGETATQDTFGTLSDSLIQQHEQIREAVDADLDDDDGEAEFRAKISDTMRPRPGFFIGRIQDFLGKKDLKVPLFARLEFSEGNDSLALPPSFAVCSGSARRRNAKGVRSAERGSFPIAHPRLWQSRLPREGVQALPVIQIKRVQA